MKQVKGFALKVVQGVVVSAPLALASMGARAEIDVAGILTLLGEAVVAVAAVGGALLLIWGTKKAYAAVRSS